MSELRLGLIPLGFADLPLGGQNSELPPRLGERGLGRVQRGLLLDQIRIGLLGLLQRPRALAQQRLGAAVLILGEGQRGLGLGHLQRGFVDGGLLRRCLRFG